MDKKNIDYKINGGRKLSGSVTTNYSKNGSVALLCASMINNGSTTIHGIAVIEEVKRLIETLESIGATVEWKGESSICVTPPKEFNSDGFFNPSFARIRSGLMLIPAIANRISSFKIAQSGGCKMGKRTIAAHAHGLQHLGISIDVQEDAYLITTRKDASENIVMYEAGDTPTISIILAAALIPQKTKITFASGNYQVQDVCFFLEKLGVKIEGIGTHTLIVHGMEKIDKNVECYNSEDPIEAMAFISIAATTNSSITIKRAPIEFLSLELLKLETMNWQFNLSEQYLSKNERTQLVDITTKESSLIAPEEKIHALPYPGINTDNLPFFVPITTQAKGVTLVHDWMWENRAIYYTEINKLGANINLSDPHRAYITGKTKLFGAQIICPPALRPAVVILIAMLKAEGTSILRDTYVISRGYQNIAERLNSLGADIEVLNDY